jgi:hypothetical protein
MTVLEGAEDLIGIWHEMKLAYGEAYLQFKEDGTYRVAMGVVAHFENRPRVEGEYWFEGKQLFIKDTSGASGWDVCTEPKQIVGKYEVQALADGDLKFVAIEDECFDRALFIPGEYERVP